MSGGKGGSSTSEVKIPEYVEAAARRNLNKAEGISQIGYTPYYGPDAAAFTPMQEAAFQNTANTADAFGMAAPYIQQDIMGGMAAPTEYAGGVRGYSSAPMYEQSLAELGKHRPSQKAYMDSFFIHPQTGAVGTNVQPMIDYTQINTMAQDARIQADADRANDFAIAMGREDFNQAASDAALDARARANGGYGGYESPAPIDSGYTSFSDRIDGGGPGVTGGAYQGGGALSAAANVATGGDGPGGDGPGGTVICTSMHKLGLISDDLYKLDAEFGAMVTAADPLTIDGYRAWATPVAKYILGDSVGSKLALSIVSPLAKAWTAEMAHVMRPKQYGPNNLGKVIMFLGRPLCRLVGFMAFSGAKKTGEA